MIFGFSTTATRVAVIAGTLLVLTATASAQDSPPALPQSIELRADGQPLLVLLERVARECRRGLVVHRGVESKLRRRVTLYSGNVELQAIWQLLRREYGIEVSIDGRRLEVRDPERSFQSGAVQEFHPVGTLTGSLPSGRIPRLGLWSDRNTDDGSSPFAFGSEESAREPLDLETLADLVLEQIEDDARRSGRYDPEWASLVEFGSTLAVRHLPEAQTRVREILERMESNTARQIVCRAFRLDSAGAPFSSVLDAEETARVTEGRTPNAVFVTTDGRTEHSLAGSSFEVIADVESVGHVIDPVTRALQTGTRIVIQPHATLKGVLTHVSVATCARTDSRREDVRGRQGDAVATIDIPTLTGDITSESALIPDGGALVVRTGDVDYAIQFEVVK